MPRLPLGIAIGVNNDNRTVTVKYDGAAVTAVGTVHSNNQD